MLTSRLDKVARLIAVYQEKVYALVERTDRDPYALNGSLETGAVRRASLDLTRALAELRRPDNV